MVILLIIIVILYLLIIRATLKVDSLQEEIQNLRRRIDTYKDDCVKDIVKDLCRIMNDIEEGKNDGMGSSD